MTLPVYKSVTSAYQAPIGTHPLIAREAAAALKSYVAVRGYHYICLLLTDPL